MDSIDPSIGFESRIGSRIIYAAFNPANTYPVRARPLRPRGVSPRVTYKLRAAFTRPPLETS